MINNSFFYQNLSKHKDKLLLFDNGIKNGFVQEFDQAILSKLSKLYYGDITGILYLYGFPTSFETIGNKNEIFTYVLGDYDYQIVHGDIDTIDEVYFHLYHQRHLDYNSWIEVKIGNKIWVYDFVSMLKIEKDLYYKLENPRVKKIYDKKQVESHPARFDDDYSYIHDTFSSLIIIPSIETYLPYNPHKELVEQELRRFKDKIDYDKVQLEWLEEQHRFGIK